MQIRAVLVGLPDCVTVKYSAALFVPVRARVPPLVHFNSSNHSSVSHLQGASVSIAVLCKPVVPVEALGFIDVHCVCPAQSDDTGMDGSASLASPTTILVLIAHA